MRTLAQSVLRNIRERELLKAGDRTGIAVSGGADSVALLRLLLELRHELGIVLSVVHFNHKLRGNESEEDQRFVGSLARTSELEFHCGEGDVRSHAAEQGLSIEAAARDLRYKFFTRFLRDGSLDRIATAHTADDQAETLLLRIARGAGARGLAGIYPRLSMPRKAHSEAWGADDGGSRAAIIRPLLGVRRAELTGYLAEIGQDWREDSSNRDLRHARNRVRHELLPWLEQNLNPAVRERLVETAEIARAEEEYWQEEVTRALTRAWSTPQGVILLKELAKLPLALQRRVLRAACESLGLRLDFLHVEELMALSLRNPFSASERVVAMPEGWSASCGGGFLRFFRSERPRPTEYEYVLSVPGRVTVREAGAAFEVVFVAGDLEGAYNPENLLDAALLAKELRVRNWRAGDRFWAIHAKSPHKVKELLQRRHVSGELRRSWPVIVSGNEVVWMRGFGAAQSWHPQDVRTQAMAIREVEL